MTAWIIERFKEPSTYRGIIWLLTALGLNIAPDLWLQVTTIGMGLAGGIGVITKDPMATPDDVGAAFKSGWDFLTSSVPKPESRE